MTNQKKIEVEPEAPVHDNIFSAIACAANGVKMLGKTARNKFDGYDFASIDKFLALVNPLCSANGLFPIVSQREVEFYENTNSKGGKSLWARFFYDITLHHSSGQTLGPVNVMVSVPMNGAQATGSAQSYALKQFFRSTLMIPTGDKDDPDLNATESHHTAPTVTAEQFTALSDKVEEAGADLAAFCKAFDAPSLQQFPLDRFDAAMDKLAIKIKRAAEAAPPAEPDPPVNNDLGDDEIPY